MHYSLVSAALQFLAIICLVAAARPISAAGMGNVRVLSNLGQILRVEIDIISVSPEERDTLSARWGSARTRDTSALPLVAAGVGAGGYRISVERHPGGAPYIRVSSLKPVYEPIVMLAIELSSVSGPIARDIPILLDPQEDPQPAVVQATPPRPAAAEPTAKPVAPVSAQEAHAEYGPVLPGETLSRIAAKVRPLHLTLHQTMLAVFRANPQAFINNNMNLLKTGHRLRLPDANAATDITQVEAASQLQAHTAAWNRQTVQTVEGVTPPKRPAPAATVRQKDQAPGKDVVKLSSGASSGKPTSPQERLRMLEEDLAARDRALSDARERIKRLEKAATNAPAANTAPGK